MFLTETDFINKKLAAEGMLNTSDIIKSLIEDDVQSPQKQRMTEGERYYVGEHDVLQEDFQSAYVSENNENGDEKLVKFQNPNKSGKQIVNPFYKILVDQKAAYIAGKEPSITVRGAGNKAYETLISDFADENFNETLADWIVGASNKGVEAIHVYATEAGEFQYCIVPASELIAVYDTAYQRDLQQVIRYYDITVIEGGRKYIRKRVEWWTAEEVTYYIEKEKGLYILDSSIQYNPSAHWQSIITENGFEKRRENHSFGRVPFIFLRNNSRCTTDLQCIKSLIDAYDLISSEGTNNLLDMVDLYWAISGYGGETASAISRKLKINKAVNISGGDGKIEAKQVDLPVAGRLEWLKMLRRDIYQFGMGIDVDADKFGNAPSGVSLKFQYGLLDMKANQMAAKIKKAIRELLWYFTEYTNRKTGTAFDSKLVSVSLQYSAVTNDVETMGILTASEGLVSQKTLLANHPLVNDVNAEMEAVEAEKLSDMERFEKSEKKTTKVGEVTYD